MSWDDILTDPEFVKQPFSKRLEVAKNFFAQNMESDTEFQKQPPELQQQVRSNFFRTLSKVEAESGVSEAIKLEKQKHGLLPRRNEKGKLTWEVGSQLHLDLAKMGEGLLKGITMGAVDVDIPYIDSMIESRRQKGEWTTADGQKQIGEFIGEFLPIAGAYKAGGWLLAKGSGQIASPAIKALAEGAYSGLIYGLAKGTVNGKSWDEVLAEGGWTAVGFGAGGAALTKATQGTGFVISKLRSVLGSKKTAELEEGLAEKLMVEIAAQKGSLTKKEALRVIRNTASIDPTKLATETKLGNIPTMSRSPQVKARGEGMEPTYTEKWTYGYPGGGPPAVRPLSSEVTPFRVPSIVKPVEGAKPLQITKQNIIFGEGPVSGQPVGKMGPGRYGRPFQGKVTEPIISLAESVPISKPAAAVGTISPKPVLKIKPGPKITSTSPTTKLREQLKSDLQIIQQQHEAGRLTADEAHRKSVGVYIKELDSIDAPDSSYRSLFSTSTKQPLGKGDTWRDFAVRYAKGLKKGVSQQVGPTELPIIEVSKQEITQAVKEQAKHGFEPSSIEPSSIKNMLEDDVIEMYAGLPLGQAKKYMSAIRRRLGTKGHSGDLPTITAAINGFHTPFYLSEIGGPPKELVTSAWEFNHKLNKVPVHRFLTMKDNYLRDLNKDQKKSVALLLNNYDKVTDIPQQVLKLTPSSVVKAFSGIRNVLNQVWHRVIHNKVEAIPTTPYMDYVKGKGIQMPGLSVKEKGMLVQLLTNYNDLKQVPPQLIQQASKNVQTTFQQLRKSHAVPRRVSGYLTRIFSDVKDKSSEEARQVIRNFADENNVDYNLAVRIIGKRVPNKSYFGPLSEERRLQDVDLEELVLDLDFLTNFYIKGAGRKMFLDRFLPEAGKLVTEVKEGSNVYNFMMGYVDQVRGLPMNSIERAFNNIPDVYVTIAGKQVLLMPNARKLLKAEGLRQGITKLGGNFSFLLFNSLQYPLVDGMKFMGGALRQGAKGDLKGSEKYAEAWVKGALSVFTKRGRRYANNLGVTLDVGKGEIPFKDIPGIWSKVNTLVNIGNNYVEQYNRTASANANRTLLDNLLPKTGILTAVERQRLINRAAIRGVGETQFYMDVTGKPKHLAGPVGSVIGRFKPYTINMVERLANADAYEWVAFLGILDILGGPNAIPGVRQLAFDLNSKYPDSIGAKVLNKMGLQEEAKETLNKMQKYSIAGATPVDIGRVTGFGFIPGGSVVSNVWRDYSEDFWGTVGEEAAGVLGGDLYNVWTDLRTGYANLKDPDIRDILQLPSTTALLPMGVQIRRTARAWEEWDKRYIEYKRERKGPELSKQDVIMRAMGLTPINVSIQQQVFKDWDVRIDAALKQKADIEDGIVKFSDKLGKSTGKEAERVADLLGDVYKEMNEFNLEAEKGVGVYITPDTIMEAFKNEELSIDERIARSKLQMMLLKDRLEQHLQKGGDTE